MGNNEIDIWDVLSQDSTPIFKFAEPRDGIRGTIAEKPALVPLTEYESDEPKLDAKGQPAMQILLILQTAHITEDSHDGVWRVYVDKPRQRAALRQAMQSAGVRTLAVGDVLELVFTGYRQTSGGNQAKDFTADYKPAAQAGADEPLFTDEAPF